ncbi:TetR/AcrR family transcriptional regulator [Planomonospora venezuelensis]|uniref:AcrR family transcriptional regulator n=1 Tax=Planomonospora venezuelensis TaxID=1999 RepID=A0A841D3K4_PLAVE|nr:TetR/AcrR family transcriptional regulator [Planomonospora venezuelensis]MBB5963084.1 AcrR family transcriptional regulator [Planomonospora venezuelensis]GIN00651.1 transcriptional regulator [Planomonospora venezuelensis]
MSDELPALPWDRSRRRAVPARIPLSAERIVDAAYTVLDREGFEKLSMRQVAAELGVAVSALYTHVSSKDELFELMYIRLFKDWDLPDPDPAHWRRQVADFARGGLARLRKHRDLARISMIGVPFSPEVLPQMEQLVTLFRVAGLPDRVAGAAGDILSTFIDGYAFEENMWENRRRESAEISWPEMRASLQQFFADLPSDRFPNLVALADHMLPSSEDERFELAVEIIIRGLASFAEEAAEEAGGRSGGSADPGTAGGRGEPDRPGDG